MERARYLRRKPTAADRLALNNYVLAAAWIVAFLFTCLSVLERPLNQEKTSFGQWVAIREPWPGFELRIVIDRFTWMFLLAADLAVIGLMISHRPSARSKQLEPLEGYERVLSALAVALHDAHESVAWVCMSPALGVSHYRSEFNDLNSSFSWAAGNPVLKSFRVACLPEEAAWVAYKEAFKELTSEDEETLKGRHRLMLSQVRESARSPAPDPQRNNLASGETRLAEVRDTLSTESLPFLRFALIDSDTGARKVIAYRYGRAKSQQEGVPTASGMVIANRELVNLFSEVFEELWQRLGNSSRRVTDRPQISATEFVVPTADGGKKPVA